MSENRAHASDYLKPCPFCGGEFRLAQEPYDNGYVAGLWYLHHAPEKDDTRTDPSRDCRLDITGHFNSAEEAVGFWNEPSKRIAYIARAAIRTAQSATPEE